MIDFSKPLISYNKQRVAMSYGKPLSLSLQKEIEKRNIPMESEIKSAMKAMKERFNWRASIINLAIRIISINGKTPLKDAVLIWDIITGDSSSPWIMHFLPHRIDQTELFGSHGGMENKVVDRTTSKSPNSLIS
ncbi:MAG TPA: hypothetical protein PLG94_17555 [Smithellaceae bacterium]|jgi:hypothetical protein|nr:hypothetical protein [Smithellaceae bacterium]